MLVKVNHGQRFVRWFWRIKQIINAYIYLHYYFHVYFFVIYFYKNEKKKPTFCSACSPTYNTLLLFIFFVHFVFYWTLILLMTIQQSSTNENYKKEYQGKIYKRPKKVRVHWDKKATVKGQLLHILFVE